MTATEILRGGGDDLVREPGRGFGLSETHQLAVVEGACNECSNCEVYCPEEGAPFVVKERVFLTRHDFERCTGQDGFCREDNGLLARVDGMEWQLEFDTLPNVVTVRGDDVELRLTWEPLVVTRATIGDPTRTVDTAVLWRMRTAWESIFCSGTPNMVSPAVESRDSRSA
jgi:putative selenate reductase